MKKVLPIIIILLALLGAGGFAGWKIYQSLKPTPDGKKVTNKAQKLEINKLPLEKRPYVILEPISKTRPQDVGSWITVTIDQANSYKKVAYDIEYQAGTLIQGFSHSIDFSKESPPVSKEGFFGSESKGKYKYDEGVKTGSILLKFYKEDDSIDALKTYFNVQNMEDEKGEFSSNDAKAILEVGKNDLDDKDFVYIASTLGLPKKVEGEILSEPYGFYSNSKSKLKKATLTIKSNKDLTNAKILYWQKNKWQELKSKVEKDSISAPVENFGTFVLMAK